MSTDKFRDRYRAPLDHALRKSSIRSRLLSESYWYPLGDVLDREHDIQDYFSEVSMPIRRLYGDVFELPGLKKSASQIGITYAICSKQYLPLLFLCLVILSSPRQKLREKKWYTFIFVIFTSLIKMHAFPFLNRKADLIIFLIRTISWRDLKSFFLYSSLLEQSDRPKSIKHECWPA